MTINQQVPKAAITVMVAMLCIAVGPATMPGEATLASRAAQVGELFRAHPAGFEKIYSQTFRQAVPDDRLATVLTQVYDAAGKCVDVRPDGKLQETRGQFIFTFADGSTAIVHLVINPASPHLVDGFFIEPLQKQAKSYDEVIGQLKKLPGTTSLFAAELDGDKLTPLAQWNPGKELAIGSAFKLYVLAELVKEISRSERHWDDVVKLSAAGQSLPGGFLQKWPVGSPITLHTLAGLMISQSDNTASDQLIRTLGREKIEAMVAETGHADAKLDQPFLCTLEMFKLKGDPARKLADAYVAADTTARRAMLDGPVATMNRDSIDYPDDPSHIDTIEWFASTQDLACVMVWLQTHTQKPPAADARQILAINTGLQFPKNRWSYIGYKGGSEPGVLNLTYLLQSSDPSPRWFVVSVTWNDPAKGLNDEKLFPLVQQAVALLKSR